MDNLMDGNTWLNSLSEAQRNAFIRLAGQQWPSGSPQFSFTQPTAHPAQAPLWMGHAMVNPFPRFNLRPYENAPTSSTWSYPLPVFPTPTQLPTSGWMLSSTDQSMISSPPTTTTTLASTTFARSAVITTAGSRQLPSTQVTPTRSVLVASTQVCVSVTKPSAPDLPRASTMTPAGGLSSSSAPRTLPSTDFSTGRLQSKLSSPRIMMIDPLPMPVGKPKATGRAVIKKKPTACLKSSFTSSRPTERRLHLARSLKSIHSAEKKRLPMNHPVANKEAEAWINQSQPPNANLSPTSPGVIILNAIPRDELLNNPLRITKETVIANNSGTFSIYPGISYDTLEFIGDFNHRRNLRRGNYKTLLMPKFTRSYRFHEIPRPPYPRMNLPEHFYKFVASHVDTLLYDCFRPGVSTFLEKINHVFEHSLTVGKKDYSNIDLTEMKAFLDNGDQIFIFLEEGFGSEVCRKIANITIPYEMADALNVCIARSDFKCIRERFTASLNALKEAPREHEFYSILANLVSFFIADYLVISKNYGVWSFKARFLDFWEPSAVSQDADEIFVTVMSWDSNRPHEECTSHSLCTQIRWEDHRFSSQLWRWYDRNDPEGDLLPLSRSREIFTGLLSGDPPLPLEELRHLQVTPSRRPTALSPNV